MRLRAFSYVLDGPPCVDRSRVDLVSDSILRCRPRSTLFTSRSKLSLCRGVTFALPFRLGASKYLFVRVNFGRNRGLLRLCGGTFPSGAIAVRGSLSNLSHVLVMGWRGLGEFLYSF